MDEPLKLRLVDIAQARGAFVRVWEAATAALAGGQRLVMELRKEPRTLSQNAHFHALCTDLARSGVEWMGKRRSIVQWKVLLVSGHAIATKQGHELVTGLEGELVNLRESTARMGKARAASLIEYTLAFCAAHDVVPQAGRQWGGGPC